MFDFLLFLKLPYFFFNFFYFTLLVDFFYFGYFLPFFSRDEYLLLI